MSWSLCQTCLKPDNNPEYPHDPATCNEGQARAARERYAIMSAAALRRRKAREAFNDSRRPAASGGVCGSCYASLNNLDPDDHSCPPDVDAPEPVLRREYGRTDARTRI